MSQVEQAITIWADESTEILMKNSQYNMVGYLITNSDKEEYDFLNELKQARKVKPTCWSTVHGCDIKENDTRKLGLLNRWLTIFKNNKSVYFHVFLYKKNGIFISAGKTYEHYFAKQCVFSLAHKMKNVEYSLNSMFKDVSTLTVLFDRRRSHIADIINNGNASDIKRFNELEDIYKTEIKNQIQKISGKNPKTTDLTIRFSFVSSECFDAMQFCDGFLYLVRKKIEQDTGNGYENSFTGLFNKHFLSGLDNHTKALGFRKIYEYDKKFNFFESNR